MDNKNVTTTNKQISFTANGKTFNFNFDSIKLISKIAEDYVLDGESEKFILNFKKLKEAIDFVDKEIRDFTKLIFQEVTGEKTGSIASSKLIMSIIETGAKYYIDEAVLKDIDEKFYTKKVTYSIDSKEVEKHLKDTGSLPIGINKNNKRNTSLTIKERKNMLIDIDNLIDETMLEGSING